MKIQLLIAVFILLAYPMLLAQDTSASDALLLDAMKNTYEFTKEESIDQNLRSYFLSDRFDRDYRNGKWSMGIDLVIDSIPFGLSSDSSEQSISEFRKKVEQSQQVTLSARGKEQVSTRILDPKVLQEYRRLVEARIATTGFRTKIDDTGSTVMFTITFVKSNESTSWPMIKSLACDGGILLDNRNRVGELISSPIILRARRIAQSDVILSIETSDNSLVLRAEPPSFLRANNALPVGSVVTSVLPLDKFLKAVGEDTPYDANSSRWAPADGRTVTSIEYISLASTAKVPDLRGRFIRGLNTFDERYPFKVSPEDADPDSSRQVMSSQNDSLQQHVHNTFLNPRTDWPSSGNLRTKVPASAEGPLNKMTGKAEGGARTSSETRPKNIALYYYIKIR